MLSLSIPSQHDNDEAANGFRTRLNPSRIIFVWLFGDGSAVRTSQLRHKGLLQKEEGKPRDFRNNHSVSHGRLSTI